MATDRPDVTIDTVDGNWGEWAPWGACSQTCGVGQQHRQRQCNNPRPQFDGAECRGSGDESRPCQSQQCAGERSQDLGSR